MQVEVRAQQVSVRNGVSRWQIGIGIQGGDLVDRRLPFGAAIVDSFSTNLMMGRQIFYVVIELFRGNMSLKQLEGPLGIAKASGEAAKEGIAELLSLMAMIGMNLAVVGVVTAVPMFWALPTSFLGGIAAAAGIALVNSTGNLGGFFSPTIIAGLESHSGTLNSGLFLVAGCMLASSALILGFVPEKLVNR